MRTHYENPPPTAANHVALSPLSFLQRAEQIYAKRPATTFDGVTRTWAEVGTRVRALAAGLAARGLGMGDTVSVLSGNRPEVFELHYAVPLIGAVLNTLNTRLEVETIAYILDHSDSRLVIADPALAPLLRAVFASMGRSLPVIDLPATGTGAGFGEILYEDLAVSPHGMALAAR